MAQFLQQHHVEAVVAHHVGEGMQRMLGKMGIALHASPGPRASDAALSVLGQHRRS